MNFNYLIQCKNRILLKNILLPIIRGNQLKSLILFILRILTLNFFFVLKESQAKLLSLLVILDLLMIKLLKQIDKLIDH